MYQIWIKLFSFLHGTLLYINNVPVRVLMLLLKKQV